MVCRMTLPSDHPANCSGVPPAPPAVAGAAKSRLKPTTPSTVYGVATGIASRVRPTPGGDAASVGGGLRGRTVTVFGAVSPWPSVAVTVISYDVSADASPVVGIVKLPARPVSGPANGW